MSIFFQSPDWNPLLSPPDAQLPYVYKLDGRLGMAGPPVGPLGIDEEKRTADFIISTNERDRGGDEMVVAGCDLSEYRINPVVLLGHRQVMPGQPDRPLPVGVATDPSGALRVWVDSQGRLLSRCHFHEDTDEAREAWLGVKNGWLRGASIGFNPTVPPTPLPPIEGQMRTGYRFAAWKLLEWSLVITPMNASCVAIRPFLEAGKIEGRSITPMFRKALEFAAEPAPAWSPGWTPPAAQPAQSREVIAVATPVPRTIQKAFQVDPPRWNRQLSKSFDVAAEPLPPSTLEYDWVSRFVERPIKHVFESRDQVPSVRMGGFLLGLRQAIASMTVEDVRNISGSSESPPVYEEIRLNSTSQDSFLVDGVMFLRPTWGKLVLNLYPSWGGLHVTVYAARENASKAQDVISSAWKYASDHNPLKGEAFSLGGEFLERTGEGWNDVFLEQDNKDSLRRTAELFNTKQASFANRGVILTGPPGTGKTLSGRILRNTAKGTFIWISSRDFHRSGSYGGISMGFKMARELAPAILFIEDVDNWLHDTTIDLVKTEMDGISRSQGVWTILTTNFPERLPEALIDRPGRFHDVLKFGLPTSQARKEMLAKWLPGLSAPHLAQMVQRSEGYSGAHVYELAHFAKTLHEQDGLPIDQAAEKALEKVEEQRQLITAIQLEGSNYLSRYRSDLPVARKLQSTVNPIVSLKKALAQIPGIATALVSGLKKGTLTMSATANPLIKAFPPGEEDNPDASQETEKPDASEMNDTEKGSETPTQPAENGVDLAQAISTLTMAIASIQEMIKPKEAPAPAPAPHKEPDEDDMPREPADQPRQDARDQENAREALDRYRSGSPAVVKGWKQEHADCVMMAADHLDELGDMETGTKWSGSHRLACKTHAGMIRKMCKEMAEADSSAGGSTVPEGEGDSEPTPQEKQQVLSAVREALGPVSDAIYRLTGKRA